MASNRHLGRIIALQTLYELDFRREAGDEAFDLEDVLARNISRYEKQVDDTGFIEALVRGVAKGEAELDAELQPIAPEWPIDQIARMDRVVLRMGLYELTHNTDVPPKVVINEAVELAKSFGGENSSKFINGVLGTVMRQRNPELAESDVKADVADDAAGATPAVAADDNDDSDDADDAVDDTSASKSEKAF
jgi:transcription antitermination protein NusB